MPALIDLTGEQKGYLTVIGKMNIQNPGNIRWGCKCICGTVCVVTTNNLNTGHTISCGCGGRVSDKLFSVYGKFSGEKIPEEYYCWAAMKSRCYNDKNASYKDYGGRGIVVCGRWLNSFENFVNDMGRRPSLDHSIDRIDNNGNYTPKNCKWSTSSEQSNNTRRNKIIEFDGKSMTLTQWGNFLGINPRTLRSKLIRSGKSMSEIVKEIRK